MKIEWSASSVVQGYKRPTVASFIKINGTLTSVVIVVMLDQLFHTAGFGVLMAVAPSVFVIRIWLRYVSLLT